MAIVLPMALVVTAPGAAAAGTPCRDAMFHCQSGNTFSGVNLRKLFAQKRSVRWVKQHCMMTPNSDEPHRCDWKRSLRTGRFARATPRPKAPSPSGQAQPAAGSQPAPSQPTSPQPSPAQPAPRRDVRGRYSTTPAPARLPKVSAKDRSPFAAEVAVAAARYKLPANLVRAVMKVESGYNPTVVSHAGAVGLMQLIPETAKAMGVRDLRDPAQNILGGARFLRVLANRFRGDLVKVLSAYHAGSTRVKRRGGTPYAATDSYVRKVLGVYYALQDR